MEKEVYENVIGLNFIEKQKCRFLFFFGWIKQKCGLGGGILSYRHDKQNKRMELCLAAEDKERGLNS